MKAREIMVQPVVTIRRDANLEEAAGLLLQNRIGSLVVVDEVGGLCGIVTESDFAARERRVPFSTILMPQVFKEWIPFRGIERIYHLARTTPVGAIMRVDPAFVSEDTPVDEVVRQMLRLEIKHVPVVRDGRPVGMISRHDLLRMLVEPTPTADAGG